MSQIFKLSFLISFSFFWANIEFGEGKSISTVQVDSTFSINCRTSFVYNQTFQIKQVGNAGKEIQNIIQEKHLCPLVAMFVNFGPIKLLNIKF